MRSMYNGTIAEPSDVRLSSPTPLIPEPVRVAVLALAIALLMPSSAMSEHHTSSILHAASDVACAYRAVSFMLSPSINCDDYGKEKDTPDH